MESGIASQIAEIKELFYKDRLREAFDILVKIGRE